MYYSKPEIIFADFDRGRNVAGIGARRRTMSLSAAPVGQRWYCLRGAQAPGDSGRVGARATNASRGPVATFCFSIAMGPWRRSVLDTPERNSANALARDGMGPWRRSVLDTPERNSANALARDGMGPCRRSVLDTREG